MSIFLISWSDPRMYKLYHLHLVLLMHRMRLRTQEMLKNIYQIKLIFSAKSHTNILPLSDKIVHISPLPIFVLKILEVS